MGLLVGLVCTLAITADLWTASIIRNRNEGMFDRRLEYVVSTARHGSFTAAAQQVGVTQSAISKSVADLERELGFSLFTRTAQGVLVTVEGRSFVERASRLLDEARDLLRGSLAGSDPYAGVLRIGVCPPSLEWLLVEPLTTLISRHPSVTVEIVGGNFDRIVQLLRSGALDLALGYEVTFQEQADFRRDTLPPLLTTLFSRRGHPILANQTITKADLAKYNLILPSGLTANDFMWRQIYEEAGADASGSINIIDSFPIVSRLVRITDAISVTSIHFSETNAFSKHFETVPVPGFLQSFPLCCATRLRWSPRPAVRALIKACRERLPFYQGAAPA